MLKDIPRPVVEKVIVAVVKEENNHTPESTWNVYLVNLYDKPIENVLVSSGGHGHYHGRNVKTSTLRHFIGKVASLDYARIESIITEVFGLNNEYWVSFYIDKKLYDKKYIFLPETITEENMRLVPVLDKRGIMLR